LSGFSAVGLVGWLADFYLLATLLTLVAILARRWLRQPARRLTVGWIVAVELTALAVICALPFWPRIPVLGATSRNPVPELPAAGDHDPTATPPARLPPMIRTGYGPHAPLDLGAPAPAVPPVPLAPRWSSIELAAAGYLACGALVVLWLGWGATAARRACRRAEKAPEPLQGELSRIVGAGCRAPRLLVSSRVTTAAALGLLRPAILLPAGLAHGGPSHALRAVLSHEWAHIRNADLWLVALGRCLLVPLFAHPLFWWMRRAIRGDQELLADAAAAGDNRQAYAEELLRLARKTADPSPIAASAAVGIWEGSSQLSRRIAMLLDETFRVEPAGSRPWRYRATAALLLLGAALSLLTLRPGRSAAQQTPAAPAAEPQAGGKLPGDAKSELADALEAGEAFLEQGDFDKAVAALTKAIRLDPQDARAYVGRACVYKRKGDLDKAGADCAQAIRLNAKVARAYFTRGWAYGRNRDLDRAIGYLTVMIQLRPGDVGTYVVRGYFYIMKGDLDKAVADCTTTIRLWPENLPAYGNRGFAYGEKGDLDKAIADSSEAIRLNPASADPYCNRACAYAEKGDLDKALADSSEAVRLDPAKAEAYYSRGYAYGKKGDRDAANAAYAAAVRLEAAQGHEAESHALDAYAAFREEDMNMIVYPALGIAEFREAIHLSPAQEKKLREIAARSYVRRVELSRDLGEKVAKTPQSQRNAETERAQRQNWEALGNAVRRQIDETLTTGQLDACKYYVEGSTALTMLQNPDSFKGAGITREQREKVRELIKGFEGRSAKASEECQRQHGRFLALLSAEQREKLRAEVERRYFEGHEGDNYALTITISGTMVASETFYFGAASAGAVGGVDSTDGALASLPVYEWLASAAMRKELGISAAQQKQLVEIANRFHADQEKLIQTTRELSPEERKKQGPDLQRADKMLKKNGRQRIEALLTPQQLAALKDHMFRDMADAFLSDPGVQEKIGLSEQEKAELKGVTRSWWEAMIPATCETYEKVRGVLTPQQQEKLRLGLGPAVSIRITNP
jgi:tetratricopeptide (TPR) repeat protein